jgi:hypothetical protein
VAELLIRVYFDGEHARPYHTLHASTPAPEAAWHATGLPTSHPVEQTLDPVGAAPR